MDPRRSQSSGGRDPAWVCPVCPPSPPSAPHGPTLAPRFRITPAFGHRLTFSFTRTRRGAWATWTPPIPKLTRWGSAQQPAPLAPSWEDPRLSRVPSGGPRCRRPETALLSTAFGSDPTEVLLCRTHLRRFPWQGLPGWGTVLPVRLRGRRWVGLRHFCSHPSLLR